MRPAFDALFDIDDALGAIVANASQPALAAIKLAWWREALEKLDREPAPAEPRLRAAAAELLPRGISGDDLAELEQPWALILDQDEQETFMRGVARRGSALFKLAARLLGLSEDSLETLAQDFAAADLGRRGIFDLVPIRLRRSAKPIPRRARPLSAFVILARRDMVTGGPPFEPEATPGRAWALIWHRLSGRY